jgi:hypothetical protein
MNIAVRKVELIEWLSRLQDKQVIKKVEILRKEIEGNWVDRLSADTEIGVTTYSEGKKRIGEIYEMKKRAKESLADIATGRVKSADTFIKEVELWKKKKRSSLK